MIDQEKLKETLKAYKKDFSGNWWKDEKYKWEAVRWFQDHWDIEAADFPTMLESALEKTGNLLTAANFFPRRMIIEMSGWAPEEMRALFRALFDESSDVVERILTFKAAADELFHAYGNQERLGNTKKGYSTYQSEYAVSTYLWLRFPDTYYVYKFSIASAAAKVLNADYHFVQGRYRENLRNFFAFYDEIRSEVKKDSQLAELLNSRLTESCWPDMNLHILTMDIGYYIQQKYGGKKKSGKQEKEPAGYEPGLVKSAWKKLMKDETVFTPESLTILRRMAAFGGEASCTELAERYGETKNFYNSGSSALAKRVAEKTGCPLYKDEKGKVWYWPVLYFGRMAKKGEHGQYIWRLRTELAEALRETFSDVPTSVHEADREDGEAQREKTESYTRRDFLNEVYMNEADYDELRQLLLRRKNIILEGAPGVGKTFAAQRLAYSLIGKKEDRHILLVQFHPGYSYEDFILGYRPEGETFSLRDGVFLKFCREAAAHPGEMFFCLIDEINRGNLSKIFGEAFMLIEKEYRGREIALPYAGRTFSIPENLYIIGTMNTADRSLALMDYALRRRFGFFEMAPGFDTAVFQEQVMSGASETARALLAVIRELNEEIENDLSLGKGFLIGHSYLCGALSVSALMSMVKYDLMPMLEEYWFDDRQKAETWRSRLMGVFHEEK